MRIAIAHDSFTQMGGAERVVDTLHEMFPEAPVFALVFDKKFVEKYKGWDIRTSSLQKFYNFLPQLRYWLLLIPWAVGTLKFEGYDLVISSSSGFIKNIKVPKGCTHINYCHTPARFLWIDKDYINQEVSFLLRPIVKVLFVWMRKWDLKGTQRVSKFLANSKEVQKRIADVYARESEVIYPPIDTEFWHPTAVLSSRASAWDLSSEALAKGETRDPESESGIPDSHSDALMTSGMTEKKHYFLVAGRLQAHKKIGFIIDAFNKLGLSLHVVGTGRQEAYLKSIAKSNITFLGRVSDEQLRDEYSGAKAFIYPQVEDFGLMPLEAAACGTPTLAYAQGGVLETVRPGETGELFTDYNKENIKELILNWQSGKYSIISLRQQAELFGLENFRKQIIKLMTKL